ncbi:phospholipase C [Clostridium tetanomorphum]|uniref:Phospholipase C n=1 Tax=Clostridium tetanomorphum TaxID=1553 RepID=A0A923E956_CLOTT|nr:zinc dependent phospholipase C family protein [Clostridium tetanomorphum]KAJ49233.1 phospholipase C zinc-binding protein [Clostridium tetanomorphum DSM 665]KAJ50372.1 phospholipase C zinc-binding protein [Clostridium tetanomorphum DSM 665]MBC2398760.1 phospholipase [Clostridium tetanomorphum]MBP1865816.1 phospholipase C [Clostridium tetanomorphum]NRS86936.1 phospholipase C [Clostridium tetanomorphum]
MNTLEKSYSYVFKNILRAVNPVKKRIMKAECKVHKFINAQSVIVLKNDGHIEAHKLMVAYISDINEGVVWADQDLKSSNHFYNPHKNKGLYGSSDAKKECISYYTTALNEYFNGDIKNAMFYLGAACHLIQDLTVPQHANVHLLNNHRSYEKWVIRTHTNHDEFKIKEGGIYFDSLKHYIDFNSKGAINIYRKHLHVKNRHVRFQIITSVVLTMAQATTAGLMFKFYKDIEEIKPITITQQKEQFENIVNKSL